MSTTPTVPRNIQRLAAAQAAGTLSGPPGAVIDVDIRHDDGCPMLVGGRTCCCIPDIVYRYIFSTGERSAWRALS